jgi:SAM-dependent methyltransferase
MAGSGTTLVVARILGHQAIGFDTDPLATLLSKVWCSDVNPTATRRAAEGVLARAERVAKQLPLSDSYPEEADEETREFVRYWFDNTNRRQLATLAREIADVPGRASRDVLWCAFSRLIITKQAGASLALDVAHSRPHRVLWKTVIRPFHQFLRAVDMVVGAIPFGIGKEVRPTASVRLADARKLPMESSSVDVVVSSPPYLNAIDYLRGHKFSLVWMGHPVGSLRRVRGSNIGTEAAGASFENTAIAKVLERMGNVEDLSLHKQRLLARYATDMDKAVSEMRRVLVRGGRAVLVVGDCTMRGVFVRNSGALLAIGERHGFELVRRRRRTLPPNRRYLPPPSLLNSGGSLANRMRTEVLLELVKR